MPDIVIQAENLGKHYPIGHQAEDGRDVALRGEFEPNYGIIGTRTSVEIHKPDQE